MMGPVRLVALALLILVVHCAAQDFAAVLTIRTAWPGLASRWQGGCSASVTDCLSWDFLTWDATRQYVTDMCEVLDCCALLTQVSQIIGAKFVLNTTAAQLAWPAGTRGNFILSYHLAEIWTLSQLDVLCVVAS